MSRYARRKDGNHSQLQADMERIGFICKDVSAFSGMGCDIIARHMQDPEGSVWLLEVKNPDVPKGDQAETKSELELRAAFPERYRVIRNIDDVMGLLK